MKNIKRTIASLIVISGLNVTAQSYPVYAQTYPQEYSDFKSRIDKLISEEALLRSYLSNTAGMPTQAVKNLNQEYYSVRAELSKLQSGLSDRDRYLTLEQEKRSELRDRAESLVVSAARESARADIANSNTMDSFFYQKTLAGVIRIQLFHQGDKARFVQVVDNAKKFETFTLRYG